MVIKTFLKKSASLNWEVNVDSYTDSIFINCSGSIQHQENS